MLKFRAKIKEYFVTYDITMGNIALSFTALVMQLEVNKFGVSTCFLHLKLFAADYNQRKTIPGYVLFAY